MRAPALALLVSLGVAGCGRDPTERALEYIPEMIDSVAYDSFAPNPVTPDRKTLMAPVPGTIPRGFLPLHFQAGKAEAQRAGRELLNPVAASPSSLSRGKQVYQTFCQICHGRAGEGDGPLIPRFPSPPSFKAKRALQMPDGQMFHAITFGQGLMASYAAQVSRTDRWRVIHYLRTLQSPPEKKR